MLRRMYPSKLRRNQKMEKLYCDFCGQEMDPHDTERKTITIGDNIYDIHPDVFDICKDCVKRICELIKDDEDKT